MSTLKVGQIQDLTGKPLVKPTGSVLQVVNTNTVGQSPVDTSTTSASYVTTGFSLSITPFSASSKLLVMYSGNCRFSGGSGDDGVTFKIYRDGTAINTTNNGDNLAYRGDSNGNNHHIPHSIIHFVNANNTNSTTFTLFFSNQWGGTGAWSSFWGTASMTIMEIAA
jgi:hypothetical protein